MMSHSGNGRCHRYAYQHLVLILTLFAAVITGQTVKKCTELNEYCQNHWECCSNSCLSYLYRCVRSSNVYPYPFLGVSHVPTVTLDDLLAQHFGPQPVVKAQPPAAVLLSANKAQGPIFQTRFGGDNSVNEEDTTVVDIVLQDGNAEKATAATLAAEMPTVASTSATTTTTMKADEGDCKEIGSKCYRDSECCTKRCHGFLHQCVT